MNECLVCYDTINNNSTFCLTKCSHMFCINCVNSFMAKDSLVTKLLKHTNCPYCRKEINIGLKFYNVKIVNRSEISPNKKYLRVMSDNLCEFLDLPNGCCLHWSDILRRINKYIFENNLYNQKDKTVEVDERLSKILHPSFDMNDHLKIFHIFKYIKHNYSSVVVNADCIKNVSEIC